MINLGSQSRADGELALLAQLIHAQDGNGILQRLVVLQDLLHALRHAVVSLAHHVQDDTRA